MKKKILLSALLSLVFTFLFFRIINWCDTNIAPLQTQLFRYVYFYLMLLCLLLKISKLNNKNSIKEKKFFLIIGFSPLLISILGSIYFSIFGFSELNFGGYTYGINAFANSFKFISFSILPMYIIGSTIIILLLMMHKK